MTFLFHSTFSQKIHDPTFTLYPESDYYSPSPQQPLYSHPPCSLTWIAAGTSSLLPLPQLYIAASQTTPTHSGIEQQTFNYAHGFCWSEVRIETQWGMLLPVPMISGAPARMAQWPEPGTAGSGSSASKVASSLPCLPSRLRWLKNRTSWDCGLNFHLSPL